MVIHNEAIMKSKTGGLKGFKTLWIRFDEETTDKHQLFFKEHSIRNQESIHPKGRTLFLLNIPPYITHKALIKIFSDLCGTVSKVYFVTPKGFKTAYIVFEKESDLEKALEISENYVITLNKEKKICFTGVEKWCLNYNRSVCNEKEMKKKIETYMQNYDQKISEKIAKEKAMEEEAENDGWVTVTGRKKRGQFALSRKESTINKVQRKEEQKNKKKQLLNFYTFQIRESKRQNLAELRKKFELDKKRLQDLKSKRTFKPF
ncbi:ribosomal RNA-processing protein 7 homolog A isoform X1 [Bombus vosnesenskii]|uniref:Ribosomal RNA-processing protein 7 homolog A isoform X1 n=2 Tax=Pyrobombus TaxID=144703 RepID=A0A6J3KG39_9HYME|nr:ribosomal RNA-processing protein 7 homolog A [Bombus bifarius]XP_033350914.1 ribosomal RNA-processing protein 7 homolog A isoform X1 [Bombus vosnesenskii]